MLSITRRYYTRWDRRRQVLETGTKPDRFARTIPPRRAWERSVDRREPVNPIHVARKYERHYQSPGGGSYAAVAEHFGVTRPLVCYYISLLRRLPADFVQWLESSADTRAVSFFTEHRLRPVARTTDPNEQRRRLKEMLEEYEDDVHSPG